MANYRLKAYESFILRDGWLTKGLNAVNNNPKVFSENAGADALGVGTNMAKSIRYWLRTSGLTEDKTSIGVNLTDLGKLVLQYDPYIEQVFTLYIIHSNIVRNFNQATSWSVFFNDCNLHSFDRNILISVMSELLAERTGETKLPERSIREDCSAILSMYCSKEDYASDPEERKISPFAGLGLISLSGKTYEKTSAVNISPDIILYIIADVLKSEGSLLIDDIVSGPNMPGKLFNLDRISVNGLLDELAYSEYISVNRTAGLDIVYPRNLIMGNDIVRKHYEEG